MQRKQIVIIISIFALLNSAPLIGQEIANSIVIIQRLNY